MQCINSKCDSEKLNVIRTQRNVRITEKGLVFTPFYDLREVYCPICNQHYYEESRIAKVIVFDESRINRKNIAPEQYKEVRRYDEVGTEALF